MSNTNFETQKKNSIRFLIASLILIAALILVVGISVSMGQAKIPLKDTYKIILSNIFHTPMGEMESTYQNIVWLIRFPRVLTAVLVGMGLSLCGLIMQASVQNPLADPYILGISSGATLGATFVYMVGVGSISVLAGLGVSGAGFLGASLASFLVLTFANMGGKATSTKLVLAGTVINAMFSSFSSLIIYMGHNQQALQNITFWTMGSVASSKWEKIPPLAIVVIISFAFFMTQSRKLNIMLMGEETAATLGVRINLYRRIYLILSSLLTGILVANCGMIGFVGLIVPHIVRSAIGSNHKHLLPCAVLFGGIFMALADLISRTLVTGSEIPVGVITSAIGAPVFLYMLMKKNYGFGGK